MAGSTGDDGRPVANCTFCGIVAGDIPATRVLETEHLIAFLDIRPLFPGHTLLVPSQSASTEAVASLSQAVFTTVPSGRTFYYTARKGDKLSVIAVRYGVTTQELKSWNGLAKDTLAPGQKLRVTSDVVPVRKAGGKTKRAVATKGAGTQAKTGAKAPVAKPVADKAKPVASQSAPSASTAGG